MADGVIGIAEVLMGQSLARNSSSPGLSRAPTSLKQRGMKDEDGRTRPAMTKSMMRGRDHQ
jgi:hypothetical protein